MKMFLSCKPLILAAFGLVATSALGQEAIGLESDVAAEPPAELKTLVESCAAHKFETIVTTVTLEGRTRGSKVKICGREGQSDADWLVTLKDSIGKTETNEELAPPVRDQIVEALKAEVARLEQPAARTAARASAATIALSREPVSVPEAAPQYSSVPALPAPLPRRTGSVATAA